MSRVDRGALGALTGLILLVSGPLAPGAEAARQEYGPDPAAVRRYGPAYRYPQAGWVVLHVEGEPYDRGYQHGRLMALEIVDYLKTLAVKRGPKSPVDAWNAQRMLVDALFLRRYDKEYLEEMKGTADGATAAGATFEGRPLDLLDVASINSEIEIDFLDRALESSPVGLEAKAFREPAASSPKPPKSDHCSAFAATGPATADGSIVFGHITMWNLATVRHFNVWLDVKPAQGHRVLMQTFPGGIQSGMDYYMNDAGLLVAETTIAQTKFDPEGEALASRIRKALQYADSVDSAVAILAKKNNGLYTNEWLIADTKANEIAMFELGTHKSKLWRSSRNEWFGGTEGFYWGCNNAKDLGVRLETVPSVEGKPENLVFRASVRDRAWLALFADHKGKVDLDFGLKAFSTPPLAASRSLDAKVTTTAMARELKTKALFGPPIGPTWEPTEAQKARYPGIKALVPNDWTTLTADAPPAPADESKPAVDLAGNAKPAPDDSDLVRPAAWHGTILPKSDADAWLAAAFADFEPVVAELDGAKDSEAAQERYRLRLFEARARHLAAVRRLGRDVPLLKAESDLTRAGWYDLAAGKGVLLLAALREKFGPAPFAALMDDFGRAHAGHAVASAQFVEHAEKAAGHPLGDFFPRWLEQPGLPEGAGGGGGSWSVGAFLEQPEKVVIVYGTARDARANREAAARLSRKIGRAFSNVEPPFKADTEATEDDWKGRHVLLVGRPEANPAALRAARGWPLGFGPASFTLKGETYADPATAVIAAGANPVNPSYSAVIFAGLGADATWHVVEHLTGRGEVALLLEKTPPRDLVATP